MNQSRFKFAKGAYPDLYSLLLMLLVLLAVAKCALNFSCEIGATI